MRPTRLKLLFNRKLPLDKAIISDLALWVFLALLLAYGAYYFAVLLPEKHGQTIVLPFRNVNEVSRGSSVRMMGLDVGYVSDVRMRGDHVEIKVQTYPDILRIPSGARFTILFTGLAGAKSIEIELPDKPAPLVGGRPIYYTEEPIRMKDMLNTNIDVTQALQKGAENIADFFGKKKPVEELQFNINQFHAGSRTAVKGVISLNHALVELREDIVENTSNAVDTLKQLGGGVGKVADFTTLSTLRPKVEGFLHAARHFGDTLRGEEQSVVNMTALNRYAITLNRLGTQQDQAIRILNGSTFGSRLQRGFIQFSQWQGNLDQALTQADQFFHRFSPASLQQARLAIQSFNRKLIKWDAIITAKIQRKPRKSPVKQPSKSQPP